MWIRRRRSLHGLLVSATSAARAAAVTGFLAGMCALCIGATANASILYVSADALPGGDGTSWASAHRFLQNALAAAGPGSGVTEIRVAQGVYKPDRSESSPNGTGNRQATFQLRSGVALLGGYAGPASNDPDERDWELYETILSGDLLGNDGPNLENYEDNSYTVVIGSNTGPGTLIEGFIVEGGNADGPLLDPDIRLFRGGGMLNEGGSPAVRHCIFRRNFGVRGGAMQHIDGGSPVVYSCTFVNNRAGDGAAIHIWHDVNAMIVNCAFYLNRADGRGGSIRAVHSSVNVYASTFYGNTSGHRAAGADFQGGAFTIENSTFAWNTTDGAGGAIHAGSTGDDPEPPACFTIRSCTFIGNDALAGGAILAASSCSSSAITGSTFSNNSAWIGGALALGSGQQGSRISIRDCVVTQNVATWLFGGGMIVAGNIDMVNTVIAGNAAAGPGGGMLFAGNLTVVNSTIADNHGYGIAHDTSASPQPLTIHNSIFWSNTGGQIATNPLAVVHHSNIKGGWSGSGANNINADPLFVQPGAFNFRLGKGSPCIDIGDNSALPPDVTTDLDGNPRIENGIVDLGPYEGEYELLPAAASAGNISPGSMVFLTPVGGQWGANPGVVFLNLSGETADYVLVTQHDVNPYPKAGGFSVIAPVLELETSVPDGQFAAGIMVNFDADALPGDDWAAVRLAWLDDQEGDWFTAAGATLGGPQPPMPPVIQIGEHFDTFSFAIGSHGMFWNPAVQSGKGWATMDRVGVFTSGILPCPLDLTNDGAVGMPDLLLFLTWWTQGNTAADLNGDGVIGVADLLLLLAAWGPCS